MRLIIVVMIMFSLWVCAAPLSHPETVKTPSASSNQSSQVGQLLDASAAQAIETAGEEITGQIITVRKTAETAARTVGKSLGNYIRGKVQQQKNIELLQRFNLALTENMAGLRLTPLERQQLVRRIEHAYVDDAETGNYKLDQLHFLDLPNVVKREYSQIEMARTQEGTVDTYTDKGLLKTRWTLQDGKQHGPAITYYDDGEIKFIDLYENGRRMSRKKYNRDGQMMFEQQYSYEVQRVVEKVQVVTEETTQQIAPTQTPEELPFKELQPE